MEAACQGAKAAGGLTVGILPGHNPKEANRFVDVKIPTGLGYARNLFVVRAADIIIAVDGKYGTLSEIAFAFNEGKSVLGIETWKIKGYDIDCDLDCSSCGDKPVCDDIRDVLAERKKRDRAEEKTAGG